MSIHSWIIGTDKAVAYGITGKGEAPVLALCQKLIAAGYDPNEALEAYRGQTLCLKVRSIGEGAKLVVRANRYGTPVFRKAID